MTHIHIAGEHSDWVQFSARFILGAGQQALRDNGRFVMALSGGSTPAPIYQSLPHLWEQHALGWQRVHILWSDERCVPLDHPESNYRMARQALLDRIDIPSDQVHPMRCVQDPGLSAAEHEQVLRGLYPRQDWPEIDLILLGMGADGHTASLFPGSPALHARSRWVAANDTPGLDPPRLTLTIPAINAARQVALLIAGSSKAGRVASVLGVEKGSGTVPVQSIEPSNGELHWLLDGEAAGGLVDLSVPCQAQPPD